jgi:integrating conjugative element protein (TIGR03749 family)
MNNRNILKVVQIGVVTMLMTINCHASNIQHVLWNKTIIPIDLPVGKEKIIEVCQRENQSGECQTIPLLPYLPQSEIASGQLKWINNDGTLYLTAMRPFNKKLTELKLKNDKGDIILIHLSANKVADNNRIQILLPKQSPSSSVENKVSEDKSIGDMIRWVSQQLYAPKRLLTQPNWIYRVPMRTNHFVPLYRGALVSAMPLATWRSNDYYITAVLMRNTSHQRVKLDYKMLRGQWIAVSFFRLGQLKPTTLTSTRTDHDTTTGIYVSSVPFNQAIKGEANV